MIIILFGMMAANVTQETSFDVAEIKLWVLGISNLNVIFYISLSDRYKVYPKIVIACSTKQKKYKFFAIIKIDIQPWS